MRDRNDYPHTAIAEIKKLRLGQMSQPHNIRRRFNFKIPTDANLGYLKVPTDVILGYLRSLDTLGP